MNKPSVTTVGNRVPGSAFVDESARRDYLICGIVVDEGDTDRLRRVLRGLRRPGERRLHFKSESDRVRREVLSRLVGSGLVRAWIYQAPRPIIHARAACLSALAEDLCTHKTKHLVMESCDPAQDQRDRELLRQVLLKTQGELRYEHRAPVAEPCLWAADAVAWAYGAGADWRRRLGDAVQMIKKIR